MGLPENVIESAQTLKAGIVGNVNDRIIRVKKKVDRVIQPLLVEVGGRGLVEAAFKGTADIFLCKSCVPAETLQPFLTVLAGLPCF